jgi:hypothetical protein
LFRPSDKLFEKQLLEASNKLLLIDEHEDLSNVACAAGVGWNISYDVKLLERKTRSGAGVSSSANLEVVAPIELLRPEPLLADDVGDDDDDVDVNDGPTSPQRPPKRRCVQSKPAKDPLMDPLPTRTQLSWLDQYFEDDGLIWIVRAVHFDTVAYQQGGNNATFNGIVVYYDKFSTLCGAPVPEDPGEYSGWSTAKDFAREFTVRKAPKKGGRAPSSRRPGLRIRYETVDGGPSGLLHITVTWARVTARDVGWPQCERVLLF